MNFQNPAAIFQLLNMWKRFTNNHPKFPLFLKAVSQKGIKEGSVIEIRVTTPDGENFESNLKLSAEDMSMIEELKGMKP